jgi:hypothetical protein
VVLSRACGPLLECERAHAELVAQASLSRTRSAYPLNARALLNEHVRKHRGEFIERQLKAEGAPLDGDLRPSVRRTIWANGDRQQVIAIRARAFSLESTFAPRTRLFPRCRTIGNTTQ